MIPARNFVDIPDFLVSVVPSGHVRLERIDQGFVNETYRIAVGNPEYTAGYLRIGSWKPNAREVAIHSLLAEQGTAVPRLYMHGKIGPDSNPQYFSVVEPVHGMQLNKRRASGKKLAPALRNIGLELARIHAIDISQTLLVGTYETPWQRRDSTMDLFDRLDNALRRVRLPRDVARRVLRLEDEVFEIMREYHRTYANNKPCIVHRDLKDEHCIVSSEKPRNVKIIDWGAADVGSAGQDLALWSLWYSQKYDLEILFDGYCEARSAFDSGFSPESVMRENDVYVPIQLMKDAIRFLYSGPNGVQYMDQALAHFDSARSVALNGHSEASGRALVLER